MSKDFADGKATLMEIIKQKEREKVSPITLSISRPKSVSTDTPTFVKEDFESLEYKSLSE